MNKSKAKANLEKAKKDVESAEKELAKAEKEERQKKENLRYALVTKTEVILGFVFVVIVLIVWFGR